MNVVNSGASTAGSVNALASRYRVQVVANMRAEAKEENRQALLFEKAYLKPFTVDEAATMVYANKDNGFLRVVYHWVAKPIVASITYVILRPLWNHVLWPLFNPLTRRFVMPLWRQWVAEPCRSMEQHPQMVQLKSWFGKVSSNFSNLVSDPYDEKFAKQAAAVHEAIRNRLLRDADRTQHLGPDEIEALIKAYIFGFSFAPGLTGRARDFWQRSPDEVADRIIDMRQALAGSAAGFDTESRYRRRAARVGMSIGYSFAHRCHKALFGSELTNNKQFVYQRVFSALAYAVLSPAMVTEKAFDWVFGAGLRQAAAEKKVQILRRQEKAEAEEAAKRQEQELAQQEEVQRRRNHARLAYTEIAMAWTYINKNAPLSQREALGQALKEKLAESKYMRMGDQPGPGPRRPYSKVDILERTTEDIIAVLPGYPYKRPFLFPDESWMTRQD